MNKLYNELGFLNVPWLMDHSGPFNIWIGGRGSGKTYGALKWALENDEPFILLRRTQTALEELCVEKFNPFAELNEELGREVVIRKVSKYVAEIVDLSQNGRWLGYLLALSTFSKIRGILALEIKIMIYDEFIPEAHEHKIKEEAFALFNAYETVNRNRELALPVNKFHPDPPLRLVCMSNSDNLLNPIFLKLKIVKKAEKMKLTGVEYVNDKKQGLTLVVMTKCPKSQEKAGTALYNLTRGSDFEQMAIKNEFRDEHAGIIKSMPLKEFTPLVGVGEVTIYTHKSEGFYYVSEHRAGSPDVYGMGDVELAQFRRAHGRVWDAYMRGDIVFETFVCEAVIRKCFGAA